MAISFLIPILLPCFVLASDSDYSSTFRLLGQITKFGLLGLALVIVGMSPLRHKRSAYLSSFWLLWSYVQWTRWFPVLSLPYPVTYQDFYVYVAQTLCLSGLTPSDYTQIDQTQFRVYCASSSLFLTNALDMMVILLGTVVLLVIVVIAGGNTEEGLMYSFKSEAKYSLLIRGVSITSQDMTIYAILQLQYTDFNDTLTTFSTVLALLCLLLQLLYLLYVPLVIYKNHDLICSGIPPTLCSTLVDDFTSNQPFYAYQYETLVHLKRMLGSCILVLLWEYPKVQLPLLAGLEAGMAVYIAGTRAYCRVVESVLAGYMHVAAVGLLAVQSLLWTSVSGTFITLASMLVFWSGITASALRYFLTFKQTAAKAHLAPAVQQDTTDSIVVIQMKSQMPNEQYRSAYVSTMASRM